jgi:two-component system, NarL family, response regulator DegU
MDTCTKTSDLVAGGTIRIVVVDDNQSFRQALRSAVEQQPCLRVVAEAEDGAAAIQQVAMHQPDIVLMDLNMPVMDGIEATRLVVANFPGVRVIALSAHDEVFFAERSLAAGAADFIAKGCSRKEILDAIQRAKPTGGAR